MIKNVLNCAKKFIMGGFIVLAILVLINGVVFQQGKNMGIHIFLMMVCITVLLRYFKNLYQKLSLTINDGLWVWILWGMLILLQIAFLLFSQNLLRYDALNVYDEAVSIFYDGKISETAKGSYFSYYANNYPITIITFLFLKIGKMLHIVSADFQNGMFYLQWINLAAIDISLFAGFLFVYDNFKDKSVSFCYTVFLLLSPLTYVWIPFYYTNTLSMPFYMVGLWLVSRYLLEFQEESGKTLKNHKKAIFLFAAGFLFYIGFAIRATVIITIIAIIMTMFFCNRWKKEKLNLVAIFLGVALGICILRPLTVKYVDFDYSDTAFPAIHWIMMGAKGEGTYNRRDEMFTASFERAEDKVSADRDMLRQRLEELGGAGTVKHLFNKLFLTFGDGTGNYVDELSASENYGMLYRCIYGDYNLGISIYAQAVYLTALFYTIIAAVRLLAERFHPLFLILLNLLGAFLFYMVWEAGTIYSIGFLPLFYVGAAGGIDFEIPYQFRYSFKEINRLYRMMILGITMIIIFCEVVFLSKKTDADKRPVYQVNQFMFQADNYKSCTDGMTLQQTFESDGLFDCISVQAGNPQGKMNDSLYSVMLEDDTGKLCDSFEIKGSDVADYTFVPFFLKEPLNKGSYRLTIKKMTGVNDILWLYYDTGNFDAYRRGKLTGILNVETIDLTFKVYYGEEGGGYFEWYNSNIKE